MELVDLLLTSSLCVESSEAVCKLRLVDAGVYIPYAQYNVFGGGSITGNMCPLLVHPTTAPRT
jgi:hypothetical protein